MEIAQHKKAAIITGICMGLMVPFGAMSLSSHHANAAVLVYDAKNVEEAIKEAIQTANILTEQEKQVALQILNTKSLDAEKIISIIQKQNAGNQDFNFCKTQQSTGGDLLEAQGRIQGVLNEYAYSKYPTDLLKRNMGTIKDVFDGKITVVDGYKQVMKNLESVNVTIEDATMSAQAVQKSDKKLTESVQDALDAANNAEGTKQVLQSTAAIHAANAMELRNGNDMLAYLVAVTAQDIYAKNMERAAAEKRLQDSKDALRLTATGSKD